MIGKLFAGLLLVASCIAVPQVLAEDESPCMECHEPAEDWEGMSAAEILTDARAPDNKRHRDNDALSDEELQAMIAALLAN